MPKYLHIQTEHLLFVTFAIVFFLFHYNMGNDFYWHIKTGELIATTASIPDNDSFSFTFNGKPWVLHEWLFDYAIYHIHSLAGIYGVKLASSVIFALSLFVTYRASMLINNSKPVNMVLIALGLYVVFPFNMPRPQLFTYLFVALYLYILVAYKYRQSTTQLFWLPLLMIFWVNIHGGYIIGIVLLLLFVFLEFGERLLGLQEPVKGVSLRPLIVYSSLSILVTLINPYTYHHWIYPFYVMSLDAIKFIQEWQSNDFHLTRNKVYLFFVFGYFFFAAYKINRPSLVEVVLPLGLVMMSFISRRHIPIAILVLLPFYSLSIKQSVGSLNLTHGFERYTVRLQWLKDYLYAKEKHQRKGYVFNWFLLVVVLTVAFSLHFSTDKRIEFMQADAVPVDVFGFIQSQNISGNVFSNYGLGGYAIYSLYPNSRVFIDGRADLYGNEFYGTYRQILQTESGWEKAFEQYPIDYVVCYNNYKIVSALIERNDFKLIFRDARTSVLVRNNEKFKSLIDKLGYNYIVDKNLRDKLATNDLN